METAETYRNAVIACGLKPLPVKFYDQALTQFGEGEGPVLTCRADGLPTPQSLHTATRELYRESEEAEG